MQKCDLEVRRASAFHTNTYLFSLGLAVCHVKSEDSKTRAFTRFLAACLLLPIPASAITLPLPPNPWKAFVCSFMGLCVDVFICMQRPLMFLRFPPPPFLRQGLSFGLEHMGKSVLFGLCAPETQLSLPLSTGVTSVSHHTWLFSRVLEVGCVASTL